MPSFVSLGALREGGILLNLDVVGAVGVVGESAAGFTLSRSMLIELRRTRLAGAPIAHLVGDTEGLVPSNFTTVRHPDVAAAIAAAEEALVGVVSSPSTMEVPGASELRCWGPSCAQLVVVVVTGVAAEEDDAIERLVRRCREHAGIVALFVDWCPAGVFEIQVATDETVIPAFGLRCPPQRIEDGPAGEAPASDGADSSAVAMSGQEATVVAGPARADGNRRDEGGEYRCFLHLLGSIAVEGVEVRPQQLAILAYLVLHGETTADALRDAVWGGKPPTRERFLNTMHELRRVVGADVLPSARDGRYRLCHVWSDLAEVERLVASAATEPDTASADLRTVLELVSGPPIS